MRTPHHPTGTHPSPLPAPPPPPGAVSLEGAAGRLAGALPRARVWIGGRRIHCALTAAQDAQNLMRRMNALTPHHLSANADIVSTGAQGLHMAFASGAEASAFAALLERPHPA